VQIRGRQQRGERLRGARGLLRRLDLNVRGFPDGLLIRVLPGKIRAWDFVDDM